MKKRTSFFIRFAFASLLLANLPPANATSLSSAFSEGSAKLDIRYRFETVDQQNLTKDANASTVRTRLGYQTGTVWGLNAYIEVDDVRRIGVADYN
ncbi:MAG: hypothetical protein HKN85_01925, partial [Gammaproteobacteria bacterium]|nr:hypothetical protein [Gammaproteobacteria bacterium]